MDTKKRNYRDECLEVMNLPVGTPDSVILKSLQSLMAQWHPDRNKFIDNEARRRAEDYYKKLNELRQGLKIQNEREKTENGLVSLSEDNCKEEADFKSVYEVLDLKVQLYEAQSQLENYKNLYNCSQSQVKDLKKQLAKKINTEAKDRMNDIKSEYKPRVLYRNLSFGSLVLAVISQIGVVKDFFIYTLGFSNVWVFYCMTAIFVLFLLNYLHNVLLLRLIEELIGHFTNPKEIQSIDKGKYLYTKLETRLHIFQESDFFEAVDLDIKKSLFKRCIFFGHVETIKRQVVDTVITDLLSKKIISISYVYDGVRTFKIEESDYVIRMNEGLSLGV